jgi:16S rRNA (guanine966-N2)-methyltransferase
MTLLEFNHASLRPTADKIKGSVFNMLMNLKDISICNVLDLFSGTGNLGIEALSRGATEATFVENDPQAVNLLTKNIEKARFKSVSRIIQQDVTRYLAKPSDRSFQIIFADPPYEARLGNFIIENVLRNKYLDPGGLLVFESSTDERFDINFFQNQLTVLKERNYRDTLVTIFKLSV